MQLPHGNRLLRGAACTVCKARLTHANVPQLRLHATQRRWRASLDFNALDTKWRQKWKTEPPHPTSETKPQYVLPMFPYPSGTLHLGHLRVYTIADVVARYRRMKGDDVMLPMGWDAFGLPAENAALERGIPPGEWTTSNIARMKEQLEVMNGSWDWGRELTTCDPSFYKHTQKLFLMLHERGLAYQAEAEVNYDPIDKTVLANEQVDSNGYSWRSGAKVERKKLKQWFFKISEFQEALLNGLDELERDGAWPKMVVAQQRNWLGKSTGAKIKFPVMALGHSVGTAIEVFTTRPDTLFGVQYLALASTHPTVKHLAKADPELQAFLDTLPGLPADSKVGYLLPGLRAVNPLAYHEQTPDATKESLPVYVAPYVLGDYGEGAVMGVPGHDVRDHAFWTKHNSDEPVRMVLAASEDESTTVMKNDPYIGEGTLTEHSGPYRGKPSSVAAEMIVRMLEQAGLATPVVKWRLRDWLISRQRYWGTPIPIVHCPSCGAVAVPDEDLPVKLPEVEWTGGKAGNALETSPQFVETTCPQCKGPAKRDTDTMDTFVDSSWYYARFADPHNAKELLSAEAAKALPVDVYLGGIEHAILHLLYARFIYKFLASGHVLPQYSQDEVATAEPFQRLITQGMVQGRTYSDPDTGKFLKPDEVDLSDPDKPTVAATGKVASVTFEKMSKSKYNGVDPTGFIAKYGADPTRAHIIFQASVADILNWDEEKISGVTRWLKKLHDHVREIGEASTGQSVKDDLTERHSRLSSMSKEDLAQWDADSTVWREVQKTIKSVAKTYDEIYYINTVVSDLMSLTNVWTGHKNASPVIRRQAAVELTRLLAPIAPAVAEECWSVLCPGSGSVFTSRFPEPDGSDHLVQPREQTWTVQVNGKQRGIVEIAPPPDSLSDEELGPWMTEAILKTELGRRLSGEDGASEKEKEKEKEVAQRKGKKLAPVDLRAAKRVIPLRHARRVAYVV